MMILFGFKKALKVKRIEANLSKRDFPFVILMVLLDIAAPIFLMIGLSRTNSSTVSLLGNFEIVATSIIALVVFKEFISKRLWVAIMLILASCFLLSVKDFESLSLSAGSLFIIMACSFWGLENNCTRKLSVKDPLEIVFIKGIGSGIGSLAIALSLNEVSWDIQYMVYSLILGFIAYGLSIFFYVSAQRHLGAARTSAFYSFAPFIGVLLAFILFKEEVAATFYPALVLMLAGSYLALEK
jgi:drug/metabolite transporter (DMT)-like permease